MFPLAIIYLVAVFLHAAPTMAVWFVADFEAISCQGTIKFDKR